MAVVQKAIKVDSEYDFYAMHLAIVEIFMPEKLTPKLKEVLISFIMVEKRKDVMFITHNRKTVRRMLNNMSNAAMSNNLGKLVNGKYLYKDKDGQYMVTPGIFPSSLKRQDYQFRLDYADTTS